MPDEEAGEKGFGSQLTAFSEVSAHGRVAAVPPELARWGKPGAEFESEPEPELASQPMALREYGQVRHQYMHDRAGEDAGRFAAAAVGDADRGDLMPRSEVRLPDRTTGAVFALRPDVEDRTGGVHRQHSFSPSIDRERRHFAPVHCMAVAVTHDAVAGSRVERAVGRSCSHLELAVRDLGCHKMAARYGMT